MGRQINFFADQYDINDLAEQIKKYNGIVIYENGNILNEEDLANIADGEYRKAHFRFSGFYIKLSGSHIKYEYYPNIDRKVLDELTSDVIELSVCRKERDSQRFQCGRLWVDTRHYGVMNNEECPIINLYGKLRNFIRKNYSISVDKLFYIGPHCKTQYAEGKYIPCSEKYEIEF